MSKLETNQVDPATGTTLTLGTSGDTISIPSGVTIANSGTATGFGGDNTPSFMAFLSSNQTLSDNVYTKIQFNSEVYDTDNAYDNSSNYRFTVPSGEAGKYFVNYTMLIYDSSANLLGSRVALYKNGVEFVDTITELDAGISHRFYNDSQNVSVIMNLSAGDYLEVYGRGNTTDSGTFVVSGNSTYYYSFFSVHKLIGV